MRIEELTLRCKRAIFDGHSVWLESVDLEQLPETVTPDEIIDLYGLDVLLDSIGESAAIQYFGLGD